MCPAEDSLIPAQGMFQGSGPPCPVERGRLEKPPYAHGEMEAVWEEGSGRLETQLPSRVRVSIRVRVRVRVELGLSRVMVNLGLGYP